MPIPPVGPSKGSGEIQPDKIMQISMDLQNCKKDLKSPLIALELKNIEKEINALPASPNKAKLQRVLDDYKEILGNLRVKYSIPLSKGKQETFESADKKGKPITLLDLFNNPDLKMHGDVAPDQGVPFDITLKGLQKYATDVSTVVVDDSKQYVFVNQLDVDLAALPK